jgi:hypothetical protein
LVVTWPEPRRRALGRRDWSLEMSSLISSSEMAPREDLLLDIVVLLTGWQLGCAGCFFPPEQPNRLRPANEASRAACAGQVDAGWHTPAAGMLAGEASSGRREARLVSPGAGWLCWMSVCGGRQKGRGCLYRKKNGLGIDQGG